ncbi:MAG TPA: hypothetical protein VGS78_12765 [Candidatus Sulfotelmatobacter sp.]|nr:hypothetical protein [Candidatus Sulfotelmatobacter sp.]
MRFECPKRAYKEDLMINGGRTVEERRFSAALEAPIETGLSAPVVILAARGCFLVRNDLTNLSQSQRCCVTHIPDTDHKLASRFISVEDALDFVLFRPDLAGFAPVNFRMAYPADDPITLESRVEESEIVEEIQIPPAALDPAAQLAIWGDDGLSKRVCDLIRCRTFRGT